MSYQRFIALGDSFTEGMTDEIIDGNFRGWADRVADVLTTQSPDFTYVNLAIRGKLVNQVAADQVPQAIPLITGIETLVSFHAGANDVLRQRFPNLQRCS
jgi:lysophospholipase L1-like esterase